MHNFLKMILFPSALLLLCISCGQRYSLFEGDFMSTVEMLEKGRLFLTATDN